MRRLRLLLVRTRMMHHGTIPTFRVYYKNACINNHCLGVRADSTATMGTPLPISRSTGARGVPVGSGRLAAIEVKASSRVVSGDFKGIRFLQSEVPKRLHRGLVLYGGKELIPFGQRLHGLPIETLWSLGARPEGS